MDTSHNRRASASLYTESDSPDSWTLLDHDSTNDMQQGSAVNDIVDHRDHEDTKLAKMNCSGSSGLSSHFSIVSAHGTDSELSDGISIISDCESFNDRHSRRATKMSLQKAPDDDQVSESSGVSSVQNSNSCTLAERSPYNKVQKISRNNDSYLEQVFNTTNIFLLGIIVSAAAVIIQLQETNLAKMTQLSQRVNNLESENLALKIEVNRLVALHHAGHDGHSHTQEKAAKKRPIKQKKVWTGADDSPIHIPKEPFRENFCSDEYLQSDDLFANYNCQRCENNDPSKKPKDVKDKSNAGFDDIMASDYSSQQNEKRKKKNFIKDDNSSVKRVKDTAWKSKYEKQQKTDATDGNIFKSKLADIYESINNDTKRIDRKQLKDTDSEWYEKMMKQREELRAMGGSKQQKKENWYVKRAHQREKVRGKHEKQTKSEKILKNFNA